MSAIRWKAVIPLSALTGLAAVFCVFFLDPLAKRALVASGEAVFGARVTIASVAVKLGESAVVIQGVQVADKAEPMKNLFEFQQAVFDYQTLPLLEKKVIIDAASLTGLKFGTPRTTSGALPRVVEKPGIVAKAGERLRAQVETFSLDKLDQAKAYFDPKTVLNPGALTCVKAAEDAKALIESTPKQVEADIAALNANARAQEIQKRIEGLKSAKGVEGILGSIQTVDAIKKDIESLKANVEKTKQQVLGRVDAAKASVDGVKRAKDEDWNRLRGLVSLPSLDTASIARMVFGPAIVGRVEQGLGYIDTARRLMPAKAAQPPPPPRGKGRTIEFPRTNVLPRFLLKKVQLSGEVGLDNPLSFEGLLEGLASNPPLYGKPLVGTVRGAQGDRRLSSRLVLDYTGSIPKESLRAEYSGFALGTRTLGSPENFSLALAGGTGAADLSVSMTGEALAGTLQFQGRGMNITPSLALKSDAPVARRLQKSLVASLSKTSALGMGVTLGGTLASPTFAVESNLGGLVSGAMKDALGSELAEQEKALRAELNKHTDAAIKKLTDQLAALQAQVLPQLGAQNQLVQDLLKQLQAKASPAASPSGDPAQLFNGLFKK